MITSPGAIVAILVSSDYGNTSQVRWVNQIFSAVTSTQEKIFKRRKRLFQLLFSESFVFLGLWDFCFVLVF